MKETKKGKEGRIGQPMFPRVHVSDTDKGGPRAPPRNKMALYEQLSIPSQRFNSSSLTSKVFPSEMHGIRSGLRVAGNQSQSMGGRFSQKLHPSDASSDKGVLDCFRSPAKKKRESLPKDDYTVPIFVPSDSDQTHSKVTNCSNEEQHLPFCNSNLIRVSTMDSAIRSSTDLSVREETSMSNSKSDLRNSTADQYDGNVIISVITETPLKQDLNSGFLGSDTGQNFSGKKRIAESSTEMYCHNGELPNRAEKNFACARKNHYECDEISEATTMNSVSEIDLTPDDVVKLFGPKRFWNARKMIADEQRVLATQLFELHRLVQVQRMIAKNPDILLESGIHEPCKTVLTLEDSVDKPSKLKSQGKKVSSDQVSKPWLEKIESSTANEVSKTSCIQESSHHENSFPPPNSHDPNMHPMGFHHPIGHQWLVPVMSPSEGLVYKPYPVPGFMGSPCGGCGNQAMCPPEFQSSHNPFQGFGILPFPYPNFPMYSMSGSVDHAAKVASNGRQSSQCSVSGAQQDSSDLPSRKSCTKNVHFKDSQQLGSTATSSSEKRKTFCSFDRFNVVHDLSAAKEGARQREQSNKVIKVVPRNPNSASESAARIFQSIQEERKRQDIT